MARTYIHGLTRLEGRSVPYSLTFLANYARNPKKTRDGKLVSYGNCTENCVAEMQMLQAEYEVVTGRKVDEVRRGAKAYIMFEITQSYLPGEIDEATAHKLGCELADKWLGDRFQYVVGTHVDKGHVHTHIRWNAVGLDLKKYHMNKYTHLELRRVSDEQCMDNHLSVIVPSEKRGDRRYTKIRRIVPFHTVLKNDIDRYVAQAATYDEFLQLMKKDYYVKSSGKYLAFRHKTNGQDKNFRSYTMGDAYRESSIRARINGTYVAPVMEESTQTYSARLRDIKTKLKTHELLRAFDSPDDLHKHIDSVITRAEALGAELTLAYKEAEAQDAGKEAMQALANKQAEFNSVQNELRELYDAQALADQLNASNKEKRR